MYRSPPPENNSLHDIHFQHVPLPLHKGYFPSHSSSEHIPSAKSAPCLVSSIGLITIVLLLSLVCIIIVSAIFFSSILNIGSSAPNPELTGRVVASSPTPTPTFDPALGAVLPTYRIVAFYAVPFAEPTGPAYEPTDNMLATLKKQGTAYEQLDPTHPVQLGIDLVVSVPDAYPGPQGTYSHHVDAGLSSPILIFVARTIYFYFWTLTLGKLLL